MRHEFDIFRYTEVIWLHSWFKDCQLFNLHIFKWCKDSSGIL